MLFCFCDLRIFLVWWIFGLLSKFGELIGVELIDVFIFLLGIVLVLLVVLGFFDLWLFVGSIEVLKGKLLRLFFVGGKIGWFVGL